ncbi:GTP-binding protein RAD [Trichonephila clavata]|uniref:GTP-binding protein RAD n=1 Tax=Trichonephila clavata TaxID=2740835 RepID=A0A8X6G7I1_TRICU|nr:GTP-binding protein RAD [Trichonephila clavata]
MGTEEDAEKNVSVMLDGEENEISFMDPPTMPDTPNEEQLDADAYIVVYSITDRISFEKAVDILFKLRENGCTMNKAVILVGNKSDLVRSRAISADEAKSVACSYECKFIETSAAINHQVDELLVGIVTQIRLKAQQQLDLAAFNSNTRKESRGLQKRMSLGGSSHKAKGILNKLLGKGRIKSQSCGNLHVL